MVERERKRTKLSKSMRRTKAKLVWSMVKMKRRLREGVSAEEYEKMGCFSKFLYWVIDVPFNFLRSITIPPSTKDTWKRFYGSVFWPFAILMFFISFGIDMEENLIPLLISLCLACCFGVATFFTTYDTRPPREILLFAFIAFIMGIVWINFICGILVDLL